MKIRHLSFVLLVLFVAAGAMAQTGTSRVIGVVQDQSGAVVLGAKVTLTNEQTNATFTTSTTDAGRYLFDAVPPGRYTIRVEVDGFKTFTSRNNVLTVGLPLTVNVNLEVGQSSTVVEVTESFERVQTSTSGNFGAILDNQTLTSLPLGLESGTGGRNPLIFIRLQPGLNFGANTGGASHVNGARDRAFNYTLDGIDINESSAGGSEFSPLRTNPDSLQEFRVITSNATSEYGRNSGAQVELRTKSGTNEFHGNLFYFHRNAALAANEWGNKTGPVLLPRGALLQHQWGGSVGGPVMRDRTFFFFNYQGQRQRFPITTTSTVYTAEALQGLFRYRVGGQNGNAASTNPSVDLNGVPLFPACGGAVTTNCINTYNIVARDPRTVSAVGTGGLDPTMMTQWLGLAELPNNFTVGDGLNTAGFTFATGRLDPQKDFVFKIDHTFNQNNTVFVRYAWGSQNTENDSTNGGLPRFPGLSAIVNTQRDPRNLSVNYRRVINPQMVNELVWGFNHFNFDFNIPTAGQTLPFITNLPSDPLSNDQGNLRGVDTIQLVDNFSYTRGAHAFRGGVNLRWQKHTDQRGSVAGLNINPQVTFGQTVNTACLSGTFPTGASGVNASGTELFCLPGTSGTLLINSTDRSRLQSMINDLLGRVGQVRQAFVAADDFQSYLPGGTVFRNSARFGEYDFYFQDNWKLARNFTVDLGLRLELKGHPTNRQNRIFVPDQDVFVGATPSNTLRWVSGPLYNNDFNNFSPSVGFAWDPFKTGKTSVRANYRIGYDRINTFVLSSQVFNTIPGLTTSVINTSFGTNGGTGGTAGRIRDGLPTLAPSTTPIALSQPQLPNGILFGVGTQAVVDPSFRAPKTHMWQIDIQREIWKSITVDVAYIGRKANSLFGAYDVNQVDIINNNFLSEFIIVQGGGQSTLINQIYGPDTRRLSTETGSDMVRRLFPSSITNGSVASVAADAAARLQNNVPLLQLAGLPLTFFRAFPQLGIMRVIDSEDWSNYHALQIVVSRKFVRNLQFQGSYTWSKSLDTRSYDPAFTVVSTGAAQSASSTPFDITDRRMNYARSDFDRAHIFVGYATYDLPFGTGQRYGSSASPVLQRFIHGWHVSGNMVVETGRPFTVYTGFSQLSNIVNSTADCSGCSHDMGSVTLSDPAFNNLPSYFTATERGLFSQPAPGSAGNTGRNFFTGPGFWNIDMAVLKRTNVREDINVELRFEFFNLTNSPQFGFPSTTIAPTGGTSSTFGRISGTTNESRKVRVGLKINF